MSNLSKQPVTARAQAVERVATWLEHQTYPDRLMADVSSNRAFVMEVLYGVIRWKRSLEWVIKQTSKRPPQPYTHAILLVALYELLYMEQGQEYATLNEAVALAKAKDHPAVGNYVNAILRRIQRERPMWQERMAGLREAIRCSHPDVLFNRWRRAWGKDKTEALCTWNNQPADVFIRHRDRRVSAAAFNDALASSGSGVTKSAVDTRFFAVPRGVSVRDLPGYDEGWFVVQDPATIHAVDVLDPQPGENILDACAAPGGKTVALWDAMQGEGSLTAMDASEQRLSTLRATLQRTGCAAVHVKQHDATEAGGEQFDAVLIDAPCTNTGVIRRRPDARWRFSKRFLAQCVDKQAALLTACSQAVRPGGRLVYSTCSLECEENEELVDAWLSNNPMFEKGPEIRAFPPEAGTDGAYAVLLRRRD